MRTVYTEERDLDLNDCKSLAIKYKHNIADLMPMQDFWIFLKIFYIYVRIRIDIYVYM